MATPTRSGASLCGAADPHLMPDDGIPQAGCSAPTGIRSPPSKVRGAMTDIDGSAECRFCSLPLDDEVERAKGYHLACVAPDGDGPPTGDAHPMYGPGRLPYFQTG